ncbi:hypothetical protein DXG03_004603 [Asterophora parasitica]|uniref:Major facilitator superfamily (MFS) profile domain-containing protein n=1 Tax=Asterophora parasitica TaxID=117018 RepID=A0A9P7KBP7_9AGAR|nr:hypothetical protein DXG03_004603 [Asterophora parasitica]
MAGYSPDEGGDDADVEQQNLIPDSDSEEEDDGRTPLDKTIDRIGMGSYQWTLLSLCGFGWMADNMWIQAIAIILPRVQQHYDVPDSYIGTVSSSMFAGMMFGAIGWGTCSDIMGRIAAFNATLCFTALFGLLASFANSFTSLCILLFLLGSAVGGSMPTDGTLLLEHMPKSKQYLVTALSVFFSVGAVLSAVVALLVLPQNSCLPDTPCNVETDNQGWRYLLTALGLITLSMFLARIVFFRLHESPRYLVHAGRPLEAIESLQMISRFNGSDLALEIEDVEDHRHPIVPSPASVPIPRPNYTKYENRPRPNSTTTFSATDVDGQPPDAPSLAPPSATTINGNGRPTLVTQYSSTDASPSALEGHTFATPVEEHLSVFPGLTAPTDSTVEDGKPTPPVQPPPSRLRSSISSRRRHSRPISVYEKSSSGPGSSVITSEAKTLQDSLWDVVIFTIGGCPGAIVSSRTHSSDGQD